MTNDIFCIGLIRTELQTRCDVHCPEEFAKLYAAELCVLRHFMVIWFLNNNALYNRLVRPEFLNNFFIKCGFASNYFMYMRL